MNAEELKRSAGVSRAVFGVPAKHTFAGCLLMDGGILGINM